MRKFQLDAVQSEFAGKFAPRWNGQASRVLENFTGWKRGDQWGDTDFSSTTVMRSRKLPSSVIRDGNAALAAGAGLRNPR